MRCWHLGHLINAMHGQTKQAVYRMRHVASYSYHIFSIAARLSDIFPMKISVTASIWLE
jgi:hypothetical protein